MAIFTVPQMIVRLTKGFMKVTGRKPDGLEKIKIKQEAIERVKQQDKVVDMKGNVIDTSKGIMGGQQIGQKGMFDNIFARMQKEMGKNIKEVKTKKPDPEKKSMGGRIGLKDGMDRRTFMKIMGGLASIPILGRYFKGAEKAAPVIEKATETVTQAPSYFFDLVAKIKMFGKQSKVGPSERVEEYSYIGKNGDEYTLTEDIVTGDAQIVKDKMGVGSAGDKTFDTINDRTVMEYKAPKKDVDPEAGKFIDEGAEYDEYKVEFDMDGTEAGADAIDEIVQKEIMDEVKKSAPPIKKASGGLAYMLGE
jgi:hypothetical protein